MTKLMKLRELGQSIWLDYIRRAFLLSGELQDLIDLGLGGVTSNPTIFEKAIAGSADYDQDLQSLFSYEKSLYEIYETLVLEDIARAADLLRPVYDTTRGLDGYVSLEVNPELANDTEGTIEEGKRLFTKLNRPNIMIKVPATSAGLPAIRKLIGEGVNVNVTLIFDIENYRAVAEAYLSGLEELSKRGGDVSRVASVASFFISRVDTAVDLTLERMGNKELQGKIAIANARVAYSVFQEIFQGERWEVLKMADARVQRPLWASTGTKNLLYPDTLYVDNLIAPHTVNTVPPATLNAFLDHGKVAVSLTRDVEQAQKQLHRLHELGIDLKSITRKLQEDGVEAFTRSFEALINSIQEKQARLKSQKKSYFALLGDFEAQVNKTLDELREKKIIQRIWAHDHTVWKPEPDEILNRLGWLHSPEKMMELLPGIRDFVEEVRSDGYTRAILLGMGGSSLAPEVFRFTFGVEKGYLDLAVLDSTDPEAVLHFARKLDLSRTLFIVSTKSGTTVETLSFFKYFYNRVLEKTGKKEVGKHFIAITDPGSPLEDLARALDFRSIFLNDPNIGGRYSALSYFGLVPAALIGINLEKLLDRALTMVCNCEGCNCPGEGDNTCAWLGVILGELAKDGRDKLTFIASPTIRYLGAWLEQLLAESTGKEGTGILPVDGEELGPPQVYAGDRLFVYLRLNGDHTYDAAIQALANAGHPVVQFNLNDIYDLGGEIFRWEMATAVAGQRLGINPFDQPNVESAKIRAKQMVTAYQKQGTLPESTPVLESDGVQVFGEMNGSTLKEILDKFLAQASPGRSYVAIQAYVQPTPQTDTALKTLRHQIRDRYRLATTVGYGPRFLHSTGQLHKGDAGKGLFIQITATGAQDVPIPDQPGSASSSISFGVLKMAQALGDYQALKDAGRRVLRFHFTGKSSEGLTKILKAMI